MGLGGISIWQLLIILLIVILVFGTKRLKTLGGDLGGALKSFRKAMESNESEQSAEAGDKAEPPRIESGDSADAEFEERKSEEHHS